ncbi:HDOD domain-containing protein [Candidatus Sulfurimonas marisnigri]|uniref:HDOD domain-containing protein n=1 Tax=Candidatus Sulfurimonas marisnigri TaxID=2740405 RepID=A0A7S7M059_9BACT|nr:HDOD domain-containing protein [Candidatus Sulfurimonas marisnigri]QOY54670.1 HDOD domain-containing protein [Candidatus Sulfurimonas marisnigri]
MSKEYEWDIYEEFKEQLEDKIPQIESAIKNLEDSQNIPYNVNNLFRIFHSFKANSDYLSLIPLKELSHKAETVLGCIREDNEVVSDSIIEWIFEIKDQLERWLEEMNDYKTDLQAIPLHLNKKIKISKSYVSVEDKLKTISLVYIDNNNKRAKKITPFLETLLKSVISFNSEYSKNMIKDCDLIMINLDVDNYKHIKFIQNLYPNIPIIPIFNDVDSNTIEKLLKFNITHSISCKLNKEKLKRELRLIVKTFFNSKNILIDNKKINSFIKTLEPLPNTIFNIIKVCDDDEMSINDLIKVVKLDPIIAANIIKYANSPIYGVIELTTVDKAVTRLGKRTVKALAMNDIHKNLNTINLSSYDIDETVFSKVSMTRLSLILKWYSKVSIGDLSILSSTALLGNIGQLLISKELMDIGKDDEFKKLYNEFNIKFAEESLIQTTTTIISAQILNYWKLPNNIIDVITYSDNPLEAPKEIRKLAIANHIVYKLIDLRGNILDDIPNDILALMKDNDLDSELLYKSLNSVSKYK